MTVPEPLARLSEGWCPNPRHGRLQPGSGGGRCPACRGAWRPWLWLATGWTLAFRVDTPGGYLTRVLPLDGMTGGAHWVGVVERHVTHAHDDAAGSRHPDGRPPPG